MGCCQTSAVIVPSANQPKRPQTKKLSLRSEHYKRTSSPESSNSFSATTKKPDSRGLSKAGVKRNNKNLALTQSNIQKIGQEVFKMQTKTLLKLIMSDLMANLYEKS